MRQQVERLLDSHEQATGFLETPPAAPLDDTSATRNLQGYRLGPYLLGARIGAGGMGEVYKPATRGSIAPWPSRCCQRTWRAHPQARERFEREARAIAALNTRTSARSMTSATRRPEPSAPSLSRFDSS